MTSPTHDRRRRMRSVVDVPDEPAGGPLFVILAGPPGAGKGTQSQRLVARTGALHLSIGDELRAEVSSGSPLGQRIEGHLERGALVHDDHVLDILTDRLETKPDGAVLVLDGIPRTLAQAHALERSYPGSVVLVVALEVPLAEVRQRVATRGRADDERKVWQERLRSYETDTRPMLSWYRECGLLVQVDASPHPSIVAAEIQRHLYATGVHASGRRQTSA